MAITRNLRGWLGAINARQAHISWLACLSLIPRSADKDLPTHRTSTSTGGSPPAMLPQLMGQSHKLENKVATHQRACETCCDAENLSSMANATCIYGGPAL